MHHPHKQDAAGPVTATAASTDPADAGQAANPNHLAGVDALRGLAAVYVVLFHITRVPGLDADGPRWVAPLTRSGASGVQLFFVVSAFTLGLSWHTRPDARHRARNFLVRRAFRIGPLFYAWLAVVMVRGPLVYHVPLRWKVVLANVLVLFNLIPGASQGMVGASWTIGAEVLFYLAFPFVAGLASSVRRATAGTAAAAGLAVGFLALLAPRIHQRPDPWGEFYDHSLAKAAPVFLAGMLACAVHARRGRPGPWWPTPVGLALFAAMAYARLFTSHLGVDLTAVPWALLVVGLSQRPVAALVNRPTRFLGRISYSMYLNHPLLLLLLTPAYHRIAAVAVPGTTPALCLALTLAVLVPASYLTYRLVEVPGIRLGSRLIRRWDPPTRGAL